jgi:ribosomal protein L12E/L44/L45/RPP1/RPP2
MKRLALIVSAIAMTATAHAQDATEFKNGGEFRLRYENFFNKSADDDASGREQHFDTRLKWNLNARKGERLQANVTFLHSARFGGVGTPVGATPNNQDAYFADDNNEVVVNRVWGWWRATDAVSFKVGRMGIEFADGAVFSENDWQATPYAHEGLNAAFDTSFAMFNLYGVKAQEIGDVTAAAGTNDTEANYYLATMDLKNMPEAIKMANVHLLAVTSGDASATVGSGTAGAAGTNQNWQHAGFTVGGDVAGFMYKGTAAFQFGDFSKAPGADVGLSANMFDVMLGWGNQDMMGFKVSAGYHMDSGDDDPAAGDNERYQALFYDRHNYGGLMDFVEWGNLTYWNVNASFMPREDLEVGVGYYMFSKTEAADGTTFGDGSAAPGATLAGAAGGADDLGSELDVFANKSYGQDLKIGLRYSMFMPGDVLEDAGSDDTASQLYLQTSLSF